MVKVLNYFFDICKKAATYKYIHILFPAVYSIIVFTAAIYFHKYGSYKINSENDFFSTYVPYAQSLFEGKIIIDPFRGPLYIFLLAGLSFLTDNLFKLGIFISSLSAGVTLYFIFKLIEKLFSLKAAVSIMLLTAFNHIFIEYSYAPGTDMVFNALLTAGIYFLLRKELYDIKNIIMTSIFIALSILCRFNAIYLLVIIPVSLIFINPFLLTVKKRIAATVLFIFVFSLVYSPWGFFTLNKKGSYFYTQNYKNTALIFYKGKKFDWVDAWQKESTKYSSFQDIIIKKPLLLSEKTFENFFNYFYRDMYRLINWISGFFVVFGIFYLIKTGLTKRQKVYMMINIFFFLVILFIYYSPRFSLPLVSFYSTFVYLGIISLSRFLSKKYITPNKLSIILLMFLLIYSLVFSITYNKIMITSPKDFYTTIPEFKKDFSVSRKEKIAAWLPHIAYFLGMKWEKIPDKKSLKEVINYFKKNKVDYIYYSKLELNKRKELYKLLNPLSAPASLQPIVYSKADRAVIYRIK